MAYGSTVRSSIDIGNCPDVAPDMSRIAPIAERTHAVVTTPWSLNTRSPSVAAPGANITAVAGHAPDSCCMSNRRVTDSLRASISMDGAPEHQGAQRQRGCKPFGACSLFAPAYVGPLKPEHASVGRGTYVVIGASFGRDHLGRKQSGVDPLSNPPAAGRDPFLRHWSSRASGAHPYRPGRLAAQGFSPMVGCHARAYADV